MKDFADDFPTKDAQDMALIPFDGTDAVGNPRLAVTSNREVSFLVPKPGNLTNGFAVVRSFGESRLAVLGYFDMSAIQKAIGISHDGDWLELRNGKAALRLNRDGQVRVEATDIKVETRGTFAISAAEIALN